jgi:S1-C subfamily serine protease
LIIAVTPGAVAHKSGIIVGDILYEIDGHSTKQLSDLQAAIAACKANTAVPIKLFRGTEPLALTARF